MGTTHIVVSIGHIVVDKRLAKSELVELGQLKRFVQRAYSSLQLSSWIIRTDRHISSSCQYYQPN
jgi:hypothetical protein